MTTFLPPDLLALEELLERASSVVPMEDVADGLTDHRMIGLRHDCDNVIEPASRLAHWEYQRGYRSTYYVLHTSPYWQDKTRLRETLAAIEGYDHEIGIHNDALTVALETGCDPVAVLHEAIDELRSYGFEIRSTVAHGNQLCHVANYVNDEMFINCTRPSYGAADRMLEHGGRSVRITPTPLAEFGLDFDANWLARGDYLSDSGGQWSQPFDEVAQAFPAHGQLHMLVHPDWWGAALEPTKVAA